MKYVIFLVLVFCACHSKQVCEKLTFNPALLDSVKSRSDTNYTKAYRTPEFSTADYYVNRAGMTVCQVMKDDSGRIRQVLMAHRLIRLYSAEYFANGQLKAQVGMDSLGRLSGEGVYYYETGCVKSHGRYREGLYIGEWKNYKADGSVERIDRYDSLGRLLN